ncbi:MAG: tryptophan--tRNA ligase, partial [Planctomycetota bacterium]
MLAFRPEVVPVGEDQAPHLEMTREVARKFDQVYDGIDPHADDADYTKQGGTFPVPALKIGRVGRLPGTNGPVEQGGPLQKMSKSLGNAIFLTDDADTVRKKVRGMYTDPARIRKTDCGNPDPQVNPLFAFLRTFHPDQSWVDGQAERYAGGGDEAPGDGDLKKELVEVLDAFMNPIREKRQQISEADAM